MKGLIWQYNLSTEEGIVLMCLAEALLRIPDKETKNLLVYDKLTSAMWEKYIGVSESVFVNFATWGLALSAKDFVILMICWVEVARERRWMPIVIIILITKPSVR